MLLFWTFLIHADDDSAESPSGARSMYYRELPKENGFLFLFSFHRKVLLMSIVYTFPIDGVTGPEI